MGEDESLNLLTCRDCHKEFQEEENLWVFCKVAELQEDCAVKKNEIVKVLTSQRKLFSKEKKHANWVFNERLQIINSFL